MRLEWEIKALDDRADIFEFIYQFNPQAAERTDEIIETKAELLLEQPYMGVEKQGRAGRCLIVAEVSMILAYAIDQHNKAIKIVRVFHQKQKQPFSVNA